MRQAANFTVWGVLVVATLLYLNLLPKASLDRPRSEQLVTLPPAVLRILSLQFKEVMADVTFLKALVYLGGNHPQADTHRYLSSQYEWVYGTLKNSVALDPYFQDPYYLMNSALMWDRYKLDEVNRVIAQGADTRSWDEILAFFVGFNYYYFLEDSNNSLRYLKEASKRSGGNPFYDVFAARIAYKANKTELAIAYLEQQVQQATLEGRLYSLDPLKTRLEALKRIRKIELAVESYQNLFSRLPQDINELVKLGMLDSVPQDDLGGHYYLDAQGRVKSTNDTK